MKFREILVIDDNDADLLYAEVILGKAKVAESVRPFGYAQEALDFLQQPGGQNADLILLDINMPEMNGFEFLQAYQRLQQQQQVRAAVVVMLTSSPDPTDRARVSAFSCVKDFMVKPMDVPSALALVDVVTRLGSAGT